MKLYMMAHENAMKPFRSLSPCNRWHARLRIIHINYERNINFIRNMIGPLGMINGYYVLFFFVETYYIFAIFDIFFSMKLCKVPMHFKSDILLPSNTFMYDMTWTR